MQPVISIIVPVYNVGEYLPECIDSLLNQQDINDIEIILVNDGSTDGSGRICDEYSQKHSQICVIHQENAGVSAARNKGLDHARARYVSFVDSDDFIPSDHISILLNALIESNSDIAFGTIRYYCSKDKTSTSKLKFKEKTLLTGENVLASAFDINLEFDSACSKAFKMETISGIRFSNIKYGEDGLFLWEALKKSDSIVIAPDATYNYRVRTTSASRANFTKDQLTYIDVNKSIFEEIKILYPILYSLALQRYVIANIAMLNVISLSKGVAREIPKWITAELRAKLKEYLATTNHSKKRRFLVILGTKAFPVYRVLYRVFRRIMP